MIDLSLVLLYTSWGIHSIPKELKHTAVFLSIDECVSLPFLSLRFIKFAPFFILGKFSLGKATLNLGL